MLTCICGLPGSGKSSYVTKIAVKNMKKGKNVFSNYPISFKWKLGKKLYHISSFELTKDMLQGAKFPENSLVIIDEVQNWFGSRDWKNFDKDTLKLFTGHRHQGIDVIVVAQHPQRIDVTIREIADSFQWISPIPFISLVTRFKYLYTYFHSDDVGRLDVSPEFVKRGYMYDSKKYKKMYDTHSLKSQFTIPVMPKQYDPFVTDYINIFSKIKQGIINKQKFINEVVIKSKEINEKSELLQWFSYIYSSKLSNNLVYKVE